MLISVYGFAVKFHFYRPLKRILNEYKVLLRSVSLYLYQKYNAMKKIFHLSTCKTCQKAIAFLNPPSDCELIDIKPQGISSDDLEQMRAHTDSYESLFSRRAMLFRQRNLGDKNLTEDDYQKLILEHYTFLKRPVILTSDAVFIGSAKKSLEAAQKALHG